MEQERLIPSAESLTVEFKSDHKGPLSDKDLVLAAVCLANNQGGDLYLGVEDDGTVTGLHSTRDRSRDLAAVIASRTNPPLPISASPIQEAGKELIWFQVPSIQGSVFSNDGKAVIRALDAKGKPTCRPMTAVDVVRRANQQREIDWSCLPASGATLADLNPAERDRLRAAVKRHRGEASLLELGDDELDLALGLVTQGADGAMVPTHAGLLLIGHEIPLKRCMPGHEVGFQVLQGTDVRVNRFLRGPLLSVVDEIGQRLEPFVQEQEIEVGMFRVPIPNLPSSCFREAFINALSHRDYTALAPVTVQWQLGESLTISNPGGFVRGVSLHNLLTAPPRSRNPVLADALKRIGLAERTGRGVDRIFEGLLEAGRPAPNYARSTDDDIVVELSTRPANLQLVTLWQDYQQRQGHPLALLSLLVLHLLHEQRKLTVEQLAEQLQRDPALVRRHVEQLLESGLVAAQGQGRGRAYTLSQRVYAAFDQAEAYRQQVTLSPEEIDRRILELAGGVEVLRRKDVLEALSGLESRQATYALKRLCSKGRLIPLGSSRGRTYQLPP
ncbi:RNA-binding domain-containing protein [Synechococcus sp. A15-44]|uniref:RNA-binding domain-containing protein n=1 Tax=Synechococcus sp. A15-44 TaxID=1050646 RepID=UPI0016464682|nr:RNA-binding domain-containing protein [Synechococcus sp. A15-44]QNI63515.1 divergent AAA domain protein [Synechococcus sp. A15-44]